MKRLLSVKETAEALGMRESTIRAWLAQRRLPRVRCGRSVRVPLDEIEKFIAEHTVPARERRGGR